MKQLHELFELTRPLFILDVETTGLDTNVARIVELGFQQYTAEGLKAEWRGLVNPGVPIPPEVTKVHGIDDHSVTVLCNKCRQTREQHPYTEATVACPEFIPVPTFAQLAPKLARGFSSCDLGGKNVRFDLRILAAEFKRAGVAWSYADAYVIDAERLEQLAVKRTLGALYEKYTGQKLGDAHQALADVQATAEVICAQLEAHHTLPRTLRSLHELQWPGWLDAEGKFAWRGDDIIVNFGGPKGHKGKRLQDVPKDYLTWIIKAEFPADVKHIASEALAGRYPVRHVHQA